MALDAVARNDLVSVHPSSVIAASATATRGVRDQQRRAAAVQRIGSPDSSRPAVYLENRCRRRVKPPRSVATALDRLPARAPRGTQAWVIGALGVGAALFLARWLGTRQPLRSWLSLQLAAIWLWQAVLAAACASVGYRLATRVLPADDWTPLDTSRRRLSRRRHRLRPRRLRRGVPASACGPRSRSFSPALLLGDRRAARSSVAGARRARGSRFQITLSGLPLVATRGRPAAARRPLPRRDVAGRDQLRRDLEPPGDRAGLRARGAHRPLPGRLDPEPAPPRQRPQHLVVPGARVRSAGVALDDGAAHGVRRRSSWTLVGVAAAARWFADRQQPALWTAFALFPGIFAYDGNIGGSADHFLGLFAAPLMLLTARALPASRPRHVPRLGLARGRRLDGEGAGRVPRRAVRGAARACARGHLVVRPSRGDRGAPSPAAIADDGRPRGGPALAVMLPHLISNFVFFRNPVYPLLQNVFTASTPTVDGAATTSSTCSPTGGTSRPSRCWSRLARRREARVHVLVRPALFVGQRSAHLRLGLHAVAAAPASSSARRAPPLAGRAARDGRRPHLGAHLLGRPEPAGRHARPSSRSRRRSWSAPGRSAGSRAPASPRWCSSRSRGRATSTSRAPTG